MAPCTDVSRMLVPIRTQMKPLPILKDRPTIRCYNLCGVMRRAWSEFFQRASLL